MREFFIEIEVGDSSFTTTVPGLGPKRLATPFFEGDFLLVGVIPSDDLTRECIESLVSDRNL